MSDLDDIERRLRKLERREPPLAAEFIDTATAPGDELRAVAYGWDEGEHAFGPVRWSPVGNALPVAGDECVIVERDDGVWQVVAWWSDSQDTGAAQATVDALDARLDVLEARRYMIGPYEVASGNLAPGAYSGNVAPTDPSGTLPAFTSLTLRSVLVDKVDVAWGLEVQWQRNTSGTTFQFWNAGSHNPAACKLLVMAVV